VLDRTQIFILGICLALAPVAKAVEVFPAGRCGFVADWGEKGYNFEIQLWSGNRIEKKIAMKEN
jgi:hypothetical protein